MTPMKTGLKITCIIHNAYYMRIKEGLLDEFQRFD